MHKKRERAAEREELGVVESGHVSKRHAKGERAAESYGHWQLVVLHW